MLFSNPLLVTRRRGGVGGWVGWSEIGAGKPAAHCDMYATLRVESRCELEAANSAWCIRTQDRAGQGKS